MGTSGAAIVKASLEKYAYINLLKTKKNLHKDQLFARFSLSLSYHIIHEMEFLILSNNANDFNHIKNFLRERVALMHRELKTRKSFLSNLIKKTELPSDFAKCLYEAWYKLQLFEKSMATSQLKNH